MYLGSRIDAKGLHTTDSKLRAITQALPPQCPGIEIILGSSRLQWEVHAQPGHYLSPTHQVATARTAMGVVCWACARAFNCVKEVLTSFKVLTHFNPTLSIVSRPFPSCSCSMFVVVGHVTYSNNLCVLVRNWVEGNTSTWECRWFLPLWRLK